MKAKKIPVRVASTPEELFKPVPHDHELPLREIENSKEYKKWMEGKKAYEVSKEKLALLAKMDELRQRIGPIGISVTELIKEGRRR
jgi:hypothetical protein